MTTKTTAADLITETQRIVASIEPLFYSLLKYADISKLDTIQISTARAREITADLIVLKKRLQSFKESERVKESTIDRHLDKMFGIN
jgi:hypothetical protein